MPPLAYFGEASVARPPTTHDRGQDVTSQPVADERKKPPAAPVAMTVTAALMLTTALGTLVFWGTFLADVGAQSRGELASRCDAWLAWELSFPLADAWMAVTAAWGAVQLWRRRPAGLLFGLVSGGAMVFLGLMDVLFFLQNGLYLPPTGEGVTEALIHAWMVGFGLFAIATIWSRRASLGC